VSRWVRLPRLREPDVAVDVASVAYAEPRGDNATVLTFANGKVVGINLAFHSWCALVDAQPLQANPLQANPPAEREMSGPDATLGERIIRARKEMGLDQAQLAKLVGSSKNALGRWERGQSMPGAKFVLALCSVLHVSADWLIFGQRGGES